jgi:hypothetical protein
MHPANMYSDDLRDMMRRQWNARARRRNNMPLHPQDPRSSMDVEDYVEDSGDSGYHDKYFG